MRYDARDRLLSVASPIYGGTIAFDYDALDNLTALTAPNRSHRYCHDARQRLAQLVVGRRIRAFSIVVERARVTSPYYVLSGRHADGAAEGLPSTDATVPSRGDAPGRPRRAR